jgi:hypothetical protein
MPMYQNRILELHYDNVAKMSAMLREAGESEELIEEFISEQVPEPEEPEYTV